MDEVRMQFNLPNWEPLEKTIGRDNCGDWMYMGSVPPCDTKPEIHLYKHRGDRSYINLSDDCRAWEYTGDGYKIKEKADG